MTPLSYEDPNPLGQAAAPLLPDAAPLDRAGLLWLVLLAILAGALTGLIGAAFRWTLEVAEALRAGGLDGPAHRPTRRRQRHSPGRSGAA